MTDIRDAVSEDAAAVAAIHVRSWQAAYRGLIPDDYLDNLSAEERSARYTFASKDPYSPVTLVSSVGDVIHGFATYGPSRDADVLDAGELYAIYVDPMYWGGGTGKRLINAARTRLAGLGFDKAVLWVLAGNARAQRFYLADGWIPDQAVKRKEFGGVQVDELRYRYHDLKYHDLKR